MSPTSFERYHCQMSLPGFGVNSQQNLYNARVLIIGIGGLGCPAAQYLASSGIGTLGIADDDMISLKNLHRQILFTPEDVGKKKTTVACKKLQAQNPSIRLYPIDFRVTSVNIMDIISDYDLIIEGTDNFETKYLINDACFLSGKPLIYGAIYQYEGHVAVWNVKQQDGNYSPNYRDVFPDAEKAVVPNCADGGVLPTLAGIIGCMQANEAIKYFIKDENLLAGKLWTINVQSGETRIIQLGNTTHTSITGLIPTIATITFDELQNDLQQDLCELIDVRSETEHNQSNIGGKNIPLEKLEEKLNQIDSSKPVVFYCGKGIRSIKAARIFHKRFPKIKIYSLLGGIEGR